LVECYTHFFDVLVGETSMQDEPEVTSREAKILRREEGRAFHLLGVPFLAKVSGSETDGRFCVFHVALPPGGSVPLHHHPYAEAIYVLAGRPYFYRTRQRVEQWTASVEGETLLIPPGALHGVRNRDRRPARLLIIAASRHERFLKDASVASGLSQPCA
jgi:quercetin dioxygenase-like cupin family protein